MKPTNKDSRRSLYEFEYPVTKIIRADEDCELGNHYHKEKDELFILLSGEGTATLDGKQFHMKFFEDILVEKMTHHSFFLKKGSVFIGFCTKPYNSNDDYK